MKLYPFQEAGVRFLAKRKRAYLADGMGLGKTAQAVVAAVQHGVTPFVVAPASAIPNWHRDWLRFGGRGLILVTSYTKIIRSSSTRLDAERFPLVILDEAHYLKTPSAKRTKAALKLAKRADRAWLLSGTPMPNDPRELYTMFRYLWPERLPVNEDGRPVTAFEWMDRYTRWAPTTYGPKVFGVSKGAELRSKLFGADPIMLRRKLEDVGIELPPLRVHVHRLPFDQRFADRIAGLEGVRGGDLSTPEVRRILGNYKAPGIAKLLIEEIKARAYKKIVVMYWHHDTRQILASEFEKAGVWWVGFDGSASSKKRENAKREFIQTDTPVFLVQQKAGGTGTDGLQVASEIVIVEPDWSPDENAQAIKRIHRIGQENPARARLFAVDGTVDASIMGTLATKIQMRKEVIG
jgi:SNF2 family DNA or RNA helicase